MYKIRKGVFETNSSSTHSISISKKEIPNNLHLPTLKFRPGEFGWEHSVYDDINTKASYFWTGMLDLMEDDGIPHNEVEDYIRETLKPYVDEVTFIYKDQDSDLSYEDGYIDHSGELYDLLREFLVYPDFFLRYLFGSGEVITSNDNSDQEILQRHYDENSESVDPEHYNYYYKGN